ncbi:MAG TPA: hypothetical protein VH092_02225 [Urbifossiella sp.]|nr:hypothetical protein [Urbifossiella sp.]
MTKPYDAGLNALIDAHLADWAAYLSTRLGLPPGPAEPLDTDLSSTLQADRLFRVSGPTPFVLHLELESTGRLGIPEELLRYSVAARKVTGLPVQSVVVMLRPKATATDLTGRLDLPGPAGGVYLTFRYAVVRLWQEPFEPLLDAGPGLAPLALLTNEAAADLPAAVARFHTRLQAAALPANVERDLLLYASVLGALRYDANAIRGLVMGARGVMEDSPLYQEILLLGKTEGKAEGRAEGKAEADRQTLLLIGAQRFGAAPPGVAAAFEAVTDPTRLARLKGRVLAASGWDDLLATP